MIRAAYRYAVYQQKMMARLRRKELAVLFRTGGYARNVMRSLMKTKRPGARSSPPGSPPRALSTNPALRNLTNFAVIPDQLCVIIGPQLARSKRKQRLIGARTVPEGLDRGMAAIVQTDEGSERQRYRRRPYRERTRVLTQPIFEENVANLPL